MIIRAAILHKDGRLFVGEIGERHNHVIYQMIDSGITPPINSQSVQGFIDDTGTFLNRKEAAKHAFECGQLPNDKVCPEIIMSEDLW